MLKSPCRIGNSVCGVVGEESSVIDVTFPVVIVAAEIALLIEDVVDGELDDLRAGLQTEVGRPRSRVLQGGIGIESDL